MASFYANISQLFEFVDDNEQKHVDMLFDLLVDGDFAALCKKGCPQITRSAVLPVLLQRFAQMCGATTGGVIRSPVAQVCMPVYVRMCVCACVRLLRALQFSRARSREDCAQTCVEAH